VLDQATDEGGLRVAHIWERVEALGAKTKSPDPHRQVEDALHRLAVAEVPEAKRVGRGLWVRT